MARPKKILNLKVDNSKQMIKIVEGLSKLNADITADATPSSFKVTIYGNGNEMRQITGKIMEIEKRAKRS